MDQADAWSLETLKGSSSPGIKDHVIFSKCPEEERVSSKEYIRIEAWTDLPTGPCPEAIEATSFAQSQVLLRCPDLCVYAKFKSFPLHLADKKKTKKIHFFLS